MAKFDKNDVYKQVTAGLIAEIEAGVAIWRKPWVVSSANQPQNGISERPYRGFNRVQLGFLQEQLGSSDPRWYTYKGASEAGFQVRKGSKSELIVFNKPSVDERDPDNVKTFWLMRYHKVFHASCVDGIEAYDAVDNAPSHENDDTACDEAEVVLEGWCEAHLAAGLRVGASKAAYYPAVDKIDMPDREMFSLYSGYVQTLAHEVIHATGHVSRLARREDASRRTGDAYAKEELIAEFGAAMLCGSLGVPNDVEQSAAYIKGWAERCREEPALLIGAINQGERASDYVHESVYEKVGV